MNGITVLIVWSGAAGIDKGQMQVGDMMAFIQYTMQIIMSFLMICMISIMLPRAAVAAERVDEILTSETVIDDPEEPKHLPENSKGEVEFEHVSFRYPGAEHDVLHDLNFVAKPGQTTAIIGSTGCGKSTLINLIPRFYDVTEGTIRVDGLDVREMTQHDLRDKIGYVPQKGVLFSGTIASNILYGNPDGAKKLLLSHRQLNLLMKNRRNMKARLRRAEPMSPVDRSRDFPSQEQLQRNRKSLFLMTVSPHWIIKPMWFSVQH